MRFDRRFLVVVSVSLLWALVVSAMFYRLAARRGRRHAAPPQKPVVVAARPLPVGATIARDVRQAARGAGESVPGRRFLAPGRCARPAGDQPHPAGRAGGGGAPGRARAAASGWPR